jgi:hypothetical protein
MEFRLDPDLPLPSAFRRLLETHSEVARGAAAAVAAEQEPVRRGDQVRLARKTLKRLRAASRLFAAGADIDPIDPAPLRDGGRLLGPPRDRHVRGMTLARIAASIQGRLSEELARDLATAIDAASRPAPDAALQPASPERRLAADRRPHATSDAVPDGWPGLATPIMAPPAPLPSRSPHCLPPIDPEAAAANDASRRIAEWRQLLASLPFADLRWRRIREDLATRWNRLRRRLRRDLRTGDDERLHCCRKACGRLETMLLMTERSGSRAIARRRAWIERIYEDLGSDRDLHLLDRWLCESRGDPVSPELAEILRTAILDRRQRLRGRLAKLIGAIPRLGRPKWSSLGRRRTPQDTPSDESPPCAS